MKMLMQFIVGRLTNWFRKRAILKLLEDDLLQTLDFLHNLSLLRHFSNGGNLEQYNHLLAMLFSVFPLEFTLDLIGGGDGRG